MDTAEIVNPAPDWSSASTPELCCPLCEYNLRGLDQPRCPECGFSFSWSELIRGLSEQHPYLFEHQTQRNIWSFWKTYWNDCRPQRFWKQLNPAHPVRTRRLLLYWFIANLALIVSFAAPFLEHLWNVFETPPPIVYTSTGYPGGFGPMGMPPGFYRTPVPSSVTIYEGLEIAWDETTVQLSHSSLIASAIIVVAWPWLTLAALLLFAQSMRKANIKKRHVLRAAVYGTDFGFIMIGLLIISSQAWHNSGWSMFMALVCAGIALYRVYFAYASYLRFHLPFWTVLSSQVIVFLTVLAVYVQ
jgi:hypothetical protein